MRFLIWNYFPYRMAWRLERFSGLAGQNISHRPLTPISGFSQSRHVLKTITPMISAHDHILSATISPVLSTSFRIRGIISNILKCSVYTEAYIKDSHTCYLSTWPYIISNNLTCFAYIIPYISNNNFTCSVYTEPYIKNYRTHYLSILLSQHMAIYYQQQSHLFCVHHSIY